MWKTLRYALDCGGSLACDGGSGDFTMSEHGNQLRQISTWHEIHGEANSGFDLME